MRMYSKLATVIWVGVLLGIFTLPVTAVATDELAGYGAFIFEAQGERSALVEETTLGDVAADSVKSALGTDIVILNGGDFNQCIPGGEVFFSDCQAAMKNDRQLAVSTVSYAQLKDMLEHGISMIQPNQDEQIDRTVSSFGGFPQISGFSFKYDLSAPPNERIVWIRINDIEIDLTDNVSTVTLAASDYMLSGGWGYPTLTYNLSDYTISTAIFAFFRQYDVVQTPSLNRIYLRSSSEGYTNEKLGISNLYLLIIVLFIAAASSFKVKNLYSFER